MWTYCLLALNSVMVAWDANNENNDIITEASFDSLASNFVIIKNGWSKSWATVGLSSGSIIKHEAINLFTVMRNHQIQVYFIF